MTPFKLLGRKVRNPSFGFPLLSAVSDVNEEFSFTSGSSLAGGNWNLHSCNDLTGAGYR
jgi:hypothetical protein